MTPLLTLGSLYVTPYSLTVLAGALAGTLLVWRKKAVRPLLPAVILGALVFGHLLWTLFWPEGSVEMALKPWEGGYTLYGALLGGALGALIAGKLAGVKWFSALDALAPGACAAIFFERLGEYFIGEGIGRPTDVPWTHFFPLSVCTYHDEFDPLYDEWRYVIWFWEALTALILLVLLLRQEKKNRPEGHIAALFLSFLSLTQILLEQLRHDGCLKVHVFIRVSQLGALITLIAVLVMLIIRRRPLPLRAGTSLSVLVFASLAVMYVEFVMDKPEYLPWLIVTLALTVISCGVMLWVWKQRKGILPAAVICAAAAALLIFFGSKDWEEAILDPVQDLIHSLLLCGMMALSLVTIGIAVGLNLKNTSLRPE